MIKIALFENYLVGEIFEVNFFLFIIVNAISILVFKKSKELELFWGIKMPRNEA